MRESKCGRCCRCDRRGRADGESPDIDFNPEILAYEVPLRLRTPSATVVITTEPVDALIEVGNETAAGGEEVSIDLAYGRNTIEISGASDGSIYRLTLDRNLVAETAYLKGALPVESGLIGTGVALEGDTLAIGGRGPDSGGVVDSGAVYVFERVDGVWTQVAELVPSLPSVSGWFGNSIAISGDTLAVGAYGDGAVYVYRRESGTWIEDAYLRAQPAPSDDGFGVFLALHEETLVACANAEDVGGQLDAGAAYVFKRDSSGWTQMARLVAETPTEDVEFCNSVSVHGSTIGIGIPFDSGAANTAGAVAVFDEDVGSGWQRAGVLRASDPSDGGRFGSAVTIEDGVMAVGAAHAGGERPGKVYLFERDGGGWTETAAISATDGDPGAGFGNAIDMQGDRLVVGAWVHDDAAGAAYLFIRESGIWQERTTLKGSNTEPGDRFGVGVAIAGDTIATSAYLEDGGGSGVNPPDSNEVMFAGAAYVFE